MSILGRWTVLPALPEAIADLEPLARNLAWSWNQAVRSLFRDLDEDAWNRSGASPLATLREVAPQRLREVANDADFVRRVHDAASGLRDELGPRRWYEETGEADVTVAYFCAEYGWHESLPQYSGGLGILAGDHTKAASDLGVPLIAVGLWYPEGYFHQRIAPDGSQQSVFTRLDPSDLPLSPLRGEDGTPLQVTLQAFGQNVQVRAFEAQVGRVRALLLDLDHDGNAADVRGWTRRLYGGDHRTRIAQEMVLGIGGVRMLRAAGIQPDAWHVNEGHSAFLALERCREAMVTHGLSFDQAREAVAAGTVFTVHTPVTAGNDAFAFELVSEAFQGWPEALGLDYESFHAIGEADHGWGPVFSMPALALRNAARRNGVAELHGDTSRRIWRDLWPGVPVEEVPIGHVTNGVHAATWMAPEITELLDRTLAEGWRFDLSDEQLFQAVLEIDPAELWQARRMMKERAVQFLRRRLRAQRVRQQAGAQARADSDSLFDPERLTIGFARRFATYKRATLIFHDLDRLAGILSDPGRPVQLVFAGKAHPADRPGQELIRCIDELARDARFEGRILFAEDYDMAVGRALTTGVDVWLNTPRRPLEASGTSGQKAAMNGVLNLSILDGWWPEGFDGSNGWAIGNGAVNGDPERTDALDAEALYALLQGEVVPLYYRRDEQGVPVEWLRRSAHAIATVTPHFNAQRMVKQYVTEAYLPAVQHARTMRADGYAVAKSLAAWRQRLRDHGHEVRLHADADAAGRIHAGETRTIDARLLPGALEDLDWRVELVIGRQPEGLDGPVEVRPLTLQGEDGDELHYRVEVALERNGKWVYGVRAQPHHDGLAHGSDAGLVVWAERSGGQQD